MPIPNIGNHCCDEKTERTTLLMPSHLYALCTHWMTIVCHTSLNAITIKNEALRDSWTSKRTDKPISYVKGNIFMKKSIVFSRNTSLSGKYNLANRVF